MRNHKWVGLGLVLVFFSFALPTLTLYNLGHATIAVISTALGAVGWMLLWLQDEEEE